MLSEQTAVAAPKAVSTLQSSPTVEEEAVTPVYRGLVQGEPEAVPVAGRQTRRAMPELLLVVHTLPLTQVATVVRLPMGA